MMRRKLANEELGRISVDDFREAEKLPLVVILDNIRSMHNVGSIFRTADAFAVEKLILTGITATPPHREIQKTALGATESVTWEYCEDIKDAIKNLRVTGWKILAVEQADPVTSLSDFIPVPGEKYALVFGNEVFGVSPDVVAKADHCLEIPQFGTKHSLNVSVSAGVVLWDLAGKLNKIS